MEFPLILCFSFLFGCIIIQLVEEKSKSTEHNFMGK